MSPISRGVFNPIGQISSTLTINKLSSCYVYLTLSPPRVTYRFTLSNARQFYSSKGDSLVVKGSINVLNEWPKFPCFNIPTLSHF